MNKIVIAKAASDYIPNKYFIQYVSPSGDVIKGLGCYNKLEIAEGVAKELATTLHCTVADSIKESYQAKIS